MNARLFRLVLVSVLLAPCLADAQTLPEGPIRTLDGRLVVGGDAAITVGDVDNTAYFNYTDYEHNLLRLVRFGVSAVWQPAKWIALVGELRSENFDDVSPYAGYVRIRPWQGHALDFQVGRIPPVFGTFGRRAYGTDNPLIGYPLAYQYLTSLRPDAVPATADDLIRMRARGWRPIFPVGSKTLDTGLPMISASHWDTGVQGRWATGRVEVSGAVTNGTLANPRVSDDNGGKQVSARLAFTPAVGLVAGVSGARGAWLAGTVPQPAGPALVQSALGQDVEYSRDHWLVRSEIVWSQWQLPYPMTPSGDRNVKALAASAEGRYRLTPRIMLAARVGHLGFSDIQSSLEGHEPIAWDSPVTRVESGIGYYLQRNLVLRATVQANQRDAGRVHQRTYFSGQLVYWF